MNLYFSTVVIALSLAAAGAVVGCGQNNQDSDMAQARGNPAAVEPMDQTEPEPLTEAGLISEANKICSSASKEQFTVFRKILRQKAAANSSKIARVELEKLVTAVTLPRARRMVRELRALPAPQSQAEEFDILLEDLEAGIRRSKESVSTFLAGRAFGRADRAAERLGATNCKI